MFQTILIHRSILFSALVWLASHAGAAEVEYQELKARAPADHTVYRDILGGSYWIPIALKEKYDGLFAQVKALQADIVAARVEEGEARRRIEKLRQEIAETLREIENQEVLVTPAKVHESSERHGIELGPDRCLFVEAEQLRIVPSDGERLEFLLEKQVLSPDETPPKADFDGIKLDHRLVAAEEIVPSWLRGKAGEAPDGAKSPPDEGALLHAPPFAALAGKKIDALRIRGLVYEEGNRQVGLTVTPGEGPVGKYMRSEWRRHARLTLFVPRCNLVAVHGALRGLEVESLAGSLAVVGTGDRDYDAYSHIKGISGSVIARDLPIALVEGIKGDVSVVVTKRLENVTTSHANGTITTTVDDPAESTYRDIGGDLRGWFGRARLRIENIAGAIDVRNDSFETVFVASGPLAQRAHRIVSETGHIRVQAKPPVLAAIPVMALSSSGLVRMPTSGFDFLEPSSFHTPTPEGIYGSWSGFITKPSADADRFAHFERVGRALGGKERPAGLDLISRSGSVRIEELPSR